MARGTSPNTGTVGLHPDDLIDDREVAQLTDDRLAHSGIVDQLAALANSVKMPSNIALYGPWGSGKSGIANLLKTKIDRKNGIRFVRFDAFKYADVPLRRNFISAVATELKCYDRKYHADLYSGRTRTEISVPAATLWKLIGVFALLLASLTAILAVIVLVIAFGESHIGHDKTGFGANFRSLSKQVVLAGLVPAALLAALISLASKSFSVDRSLAKPESDEQFEALFKELVADTGAKRLVVFVDELDRCSPDEVVATLDTVRTFLGTDRCVFVIAADQNVLETALTRAAKQETPADDANPYYSTGSAYLDKVFQYQLSLPPLLAQSVSNYATTLVEGRGGLWADINTEYVLSVLVPTHVSSPRRVKHLLNTFALTYRLAEERHRTDLLREDPRAVAASIARLVCLRVEFPLFARHLQVEANLPNLVLQLMRDPGATLPSGTSERAEQLARSYALHTAAPGTVLLDQDPDDDSDSDDDEFGEEESMGGPRTQTVAAHNKQLLNYLSRTRQVPGPSRDLIYMQSGGAVFGLEGELALAIEQAAEDGDIDTLQQRINRLDDAGREGALHLLAHQVRTGSGITGPNTARSFLLLTEQMPDLPLGNVVDSVAEAICIQEDESGDILDEETAASAWALAKAGTESGAIDLRRRVLAVATQQGLQPQGFLFADAVNALAAAPETMTAYFSTRLVSPDASKTAASLFALDDQDVIQVIHAIQAPVATNIAQATHAHQAWVKATKDAAAASSATTTTPATRAAAPTQAAPAPNPGEEPFNPKPVLEALLHQASDRETAVQHAVLRVLFAANTYDARSTALALIRKTQPTSDSALIADILDAARMRTVDRWTDWLSGVEATAVTPDHALPISALVQEAWTEGSDLAETQAALQALRPFVEMLPDDTRPDLTDTVIKEIKPAPVNDNDDATNRRDLLGRAQVFANEDMLDYDALMPAVARSIQDTLARDIPVVGRDEPLYQYVMTEGSVSLNISAATLADDDISGILQEAVASPWLDDLGHVEVTLELAHAVGSDHLGSVDLPSGATVADMVHNYGRSAAHAACRWVELVRPGPDDLAPVYERLEAENALTDDLITQTRRIQRTWTEDQHRSFLDRYLADATAEVPNDLALRAIGLDVADDAIVTDLLCARFAAASNNNQRQAVATLWAKAKVENNASRRRLFETVIYGLLDLHTRSTSNLGAVEIALNTLRLVGKPLPQGVKGALGKRVKDATGGNKSLESKALAIMPALGYPTSSGLFRTKKVKYDDPS